MQEAYPDLDEVQQIEEPYIPIPVGVSIDGPVTVHQLPSRAGPVTAQELSTDPVKVLAADPKRRRAVICGTDDFHVSHMQSASAGGVWPGLVPLVLEHADAVWAYVVNSDTSTLTIVTEYWAD